MVSSVFRAGAFQSAFQVLISYPPAAANHSAPLFLFSPSRSHASVSFISSPLSPSRPLPHPTLHPTLLSTFPSVRRCGKRHVLSFPQCSAGCQCRRWIPSRQLCLCWALWFTVRGHSPPNWQPVKAPLLAALSSGEFLTTRSQSKHRDW